MEINNLIIIAVCVVVAYVLFKVLKSVLKILLPIAIIFGGSYYIYLNIKDVNVLQKIDSIYCSEENYDKVKCNCVSQFVITKINNDYSNEEIEALKNDPVEGLTIISKILTENRSQITNCLNENGKVIISFEEIISDLKSLIK